MKRILLVTLIALGLAQSGRAANLVWTPSTADWDILTTANWKDTNTLATVTFNQGDDVLFDNTGTGQAAVALGANSLSPNSVLVDSSSQYSFASTTGGKLDGNLVLVKRGSGTLILDADNTITGPTDVQEGTLQIGNAASRGTLGSGNVTNNSVLVINRSGTLNFSNNVTGPGDLSTTGGTINMRGTNTITGSIVHNAAIVNFLGSSTIGNPSDITISAAANTRFQISGGIDLPSTCPVYCTGAISGVRDALQSMDGTNSVSGPIYVGQGAAGGLVQLMAMNADSELNVYGDVADLDATPYNGSLYLRGTSGTGNMYGSINLPDANLIKTDAGGTWTIYSTGNSAAATLVAQGVLRLGAHNALPNAEFSIGQFGATATLDLGGFNQQITTLYDVGGTVTIGNSSTTSDSVLTLSGGGVYGGSIQDAISGGTQKVGITLLSGAQQLTASCTYSGPTTIVGGGIALVGSGDIPNTTPIEFVNGTAIDARFKSDATLTLQAAQTLKGNGTFHVNGNLTILGAVELKVNKSGGTITTDHITSDSPYSITYGGTLNLDLSGDPLSSTDILPLFTADSYTSASAFSSIVPATPGPGLTWDANTLTTDGTLRIVASIPTTPTNITFSVVSGGTQLEIAWPESYTGWTLQGQTNAPLTGLTANWFDVPDSAATNRVFLPIDPANGSVFYRLYYLQP